MKIKKGYFYFIKDSYYEKVQDKELMQNKEKGTKRPCFYCFQDEKVGDLYWFIPISSKVEKYKSIYNNKIRKQLEKNKKPIVDTLVFGKINNKERVFLIQNMFPIIEKYISDAYITNNLPVQIGYELRQEIETKANKVFSLVRKGNKGLVFPDIIRIKNIMIKEIEEEYDLKCHKKAIEEYKKNHKTYTIEEIKGRLGL